jgi:hypothetical protein
MQGLVDAAVVVIAVVIPALNFELAKKFVHPYSLLLDGWMLKVFDGNHVTIPVTF